MYSQLKRIADLVSSLLGMIVLIPILVPIMVSLRLTGEGEVFYQQERMGYKHRPFGIVKFATMLKNSLNIGSKTITTRNDPRITIIGKYLRITKINELPQIINVIKGDMSLVGPRPLLVTSFYKYTPEVQAIIYQNRPGVTGIGSLVFRDEEKLVSAYSNTGRDPMEYYKNHIYPYKGALETWYYHNISFWTDTRILVLTALSLVFKDSELVFKVLKDLPPKPEALSMAWIAKQSLLS